MRFLALTDWDPARRQNRDRGWSWDREPSMGALDKAVALRHAACEHPRFPYEFEAHTAADYVHDGIDRAYFVKVDFVGRHSVNLSFRIGDALEHSN